MKIPDAVHVPFEWVYGLVCGDVECPYCTFYRGVALGAVVVGLIAYFIR